MSNSKKTNLTHENKKRKEHIMRKHQQRDEMIHCYLIAKLNVFVTTTHKVTECFCSTAF